MALGLLTLLISIYHSDGSNMLLLSEWVQRIVTFRSGAADQISNIGIVFKLHLFLGTTIFWSFPSVAWYMCGAFRWAILLALIKWFVDNDSLCEVRYTYLLAAHSNLSTQ